MCGRFGASYRDIKTVWNLYRNFSFQTRYNIAPSQEVPVIIRNEERNEAKLMKWGLVPSWAPDPSMGQRMINARSETPAGKAIIQASCTEKTLPGSGQWILRVAARG
jgi:putative SOS response-associated peptidase YedK